MVVAGVRARRPWVAAVGIGGVFVSVPLAVAELFDARLGPLVGILAVGLALVAPHEKRRVQLLGARSGRARPGRDRLQRRARAGDERGRGCGREGGRGRKRRSRPRGPGPRR